MLQKPLEGIRVLAVETQVSAPYCTMMLADAGAEVIKIETPGRGDVAREPGPILKNDKGEKVSGYFMRFNRNKKSLTLNLKEPKGQELLKELVREADVLVENLRPGTLKSMGLGYEELDAVNPKLIYASISGFGQMEGLVGPYSQRPAYDIVIQAMTGMMHLIGYEDGPPLHPMIALGDIIPGIVTAYSIMLALLKRGKTGIGDYIDTSMFDVMMAITERAHTVYSLTESIMGRGKEALIHPWGAYKTKDGYVALIVLEAKMWQRFCEVIDHPELFEDPRFENAMLRAQNRKDLDPVIEKWMEQYTSEEATEKLLDAGVPVGPVRTSKDIYHCEQAKARHMWVETNDPVASRVKLVGSPVKMKRVPVDKEVDPAPLLGQHTEEILSRVLKFGSGEIATFKEQGII
jgi:CoA:oxalate CoA-transferase